MRGAPAKQPYAIAMKDGSPFGLAGLWENWKNPNTGKWERTFAIITVPSNELVGRYRGYKIKVAPNHKGWRVRASADA